MDRLAQLWATTVFSVFDSMDCAGLTQGAQLVRKRSLSVSDKIAGNHLPFSNTRQVPDPSGQRLRPGLPCPGLLLLKCAPSAQPMCGLAQFHKLTRGPRSCGCWIRAPSA